MAKKQTKAPVVKSTEQQVIETRVGPEEGVGEWTPGVSLATALSIVKSAVLDLGTHPLRVDCERNFHQLEGVLLEAKRRNQQS